MADDDLVNGAFLVGAGPALTGVSVGVGGESECTAMYADLDAPRQSSRHPLATAHPVERDRNRLILQRLTRPSSALTGDDERARLA
ncbi:MAG TPA: hypothetical protein VFP14_01220 [Novosphingobium sp.]|nr:hypothetical protein [Novosphingobium sp.]